MLNYLETRGTKKTVLTYNNFFCYVDKYGNSDLVLIYVYLYITSDINILPKYYICYNLVWPMEFSIIGYNLWSY